MAQRTGRASIVVLGVSLLKIILQFGSVIILARLVPPAEYGIAALALPVALIMANVSQFGLAQTVVQMPVMRHRLASTLFWVNVTLGVSFGGLMAAGSGIAARFYGVPEVGPIFIALGISVVFSSILTLYIGILRRRLQIRLLEYGQLFSFFCSIVIAVIAALLGASYWAIIIQHMSQPIINVMIYAFALRWFPSAPWTAGLRGAGSALRFGSSLAWSSLLLYVGQALPVIMIGRYYAPFDAGLFQRSNTLARLVPTLVASPLGAIFMSTLSRLQDDPAAFRAMFLRLISRLNFILMPIGVIGFTMADIFVPLVLGQEWAAAAPVMAWLCLLILQNPLEQGVVWALSAAGAGKQIRSFGIVSLAVIVLTLSVVGYDHSVATLAAALALGNMILRLPIITYLCVGHTHIDLQTVLRGYGFDLAIAGGAIGLVLGLRQILGDAPLTTHVIASFGLLAVVYGVRIISDSGLRHDIGTVIRRGERRNPA